MGAEGQLLDHKSLKAILGNSADWDEIAKDCIAFANASGGRLLIGIEDGQELPPSGQTVPDHLPDLLRRKLNERTVNLHLSPAVSTAQNGAQYIELRIARSISVASTTGGQYFLRVADQSKPITGDDVIRLINERSTLPWETQTSLHVSKADLDQRRCSSLLNALRASDRVKPSVKEKTDDELLAHYQLAIGPFLTNLGILFVGQQHQRALVGTAPAVQVIKFDDRGDKVNKLLWDDHTLSPIELIEAVWAEVPDFKERYELPDGLYRQNVPAFDEVVIRELLVNALVHRPYTQRGDIFLNLFPDRLEVVNPGSLPLGVTPQNILHTSVRRNEHFARLFHDLKLMEKEGSGYDKIFEVLLSQGRPEPELLEAHDRVQVTIRRRILKPEVIDFIAKADQTYQLSQRERISLGLLAQHDALTARELADRLELSTVDELQPWVRRLLDLGLVHHTGRTQATRYFIAPNLLRSMDFSGKTTLKLIEPHRLAALVFEDLQRYPGSAISEIHKRIGVELNQKQVKRALEQLTEQGKVQAEGINRWRRYWAKV